MQASKSYRVLVVEDEAPVAADIVQRLEIFGHRVAGVAFTAEDALDLAGQADLVLLDSRLDGWGDGVDAALKIRRCYHIPVIFLTKFADRATLDRARRAGNFGYLADPLTPSTLEAALETAVSRPALPPQWEALMGEFASVS